MWVISVQVVKYPECWRKSIVEKDEFGWPLQKHPTVDCYWLYDTIWKSDKKENGKQCIKN